MRKRNFFQLTGVMLLFVMALTLSSCGVRHRGDEGISPIEPIAPGANNVGAYPLQGRFSVRRGEVQLRELSASRDGALVMVGTSSRSLYLLGGEGELIWEKTLSSELLQAVMDPERRLLALGTAGGKLIIIDPAQPQLPEEFDFDAPVGILDISRDGERILVGLTPEDKQAEDVLFLLDRQGNKLWQKRVAELLEARIGGNENRIFVNWQKGGEPTISAYSSQGEKLWELQNRSQMALDASGRSLVSVQGKEVLRSDETAVTLGSYTAAGIVNRVIMAETGAFFSILTTDEATQKQELLYFDFAGNKLWSKRLPNDSDVLLSADGQRIIVASWRQYRDDTTQVVIYNQHGEQVNQLDVAGRAQKMALADRADILVLGLEEGIIYFLNIAAGANKRLKTSADTGQQGLQQHYAPVSFVRPAGESLVTLFFHDSEKEHLIPVTRRIKRPRSVIRASIEELIKGALQGSNLSRTIPKNVEIRVSQTEGVVQLNLPAALDEMSGSAFLQGILESLLLTVSQFPTVRQIEFIVEGERRATFGQEGLNIGKAFTPARFGQRQGERLIFLPSRSDSRYYLRAESVLLSALQGEALIEALVRHILTQSSEFYSLQLAGVRIENKTVYLDFTESLHSLLSDSSEAAARAAMLRDALALTISENAPHAKISITVNGKSPEQPEHFLPWEITVSRPFYLNLED